MQAVENGPTAFILQAAFRSRTADRGGERDDGRRTERAAAGDQGLGDGQASGDAAGFAGGDFDAEEMREAVRIFRTRATLESILEDIRAGRERR